MSKSKNIITTNEYKKFYEFYSINLVQLYIGLNQIDAIIFKNEQLK
ncbi:MAG: hypothetical protein PHS42_07170 [Sulfurimonas sp.]|nr:hypothetical protein [Sulfurimonas sp.]MDD3835239.1 hypothetical protein [Sulfurimonas sp.]